MEAFSEVLKFCLNLQSCKKKFKSPPPPEVFKHKRKQTCSEVTELSIPEGVKLKRLMTTLPKLKTWMTFSQPRNFIIDEVHPLSIRTKIPPVAT